MARESERASERERARRKSLDDEMISLADEDERAHRPDLDALLSPAATQHSSAKFVSQKVFIKSFGKSQFPHKFVNLFFILVIIKVTLYQ
jgi:hypothetical protein